LIDAFDCAQPVAPAEQWSPGHSCGARHLHPTRARLNPRPNPEGNVMLSRSTITRIALTTAAAAAIAVPLATAPPAAAATGPNTFAHCPTSATGGCVGYTVTGAQFQRITATVFLRNPTQYVPITDGIGWDESLVAGSRWRVTLGVSNTTSSPSAVWSPSFLVFHNGALVSGADVTAMWCPTPGDPCQPASAGGGFPTSSTVTMTTTYDRSEGTVNVAATDLNHQLYRAFFYVGTGLSFDQGLIEAGFGAFTAPTSVTRLLRFTGAGVSTYNGRSHSLASFFVHSKIIATSDGTSMGTRQAVPANLDTGGTGFNANFQP